MAIVKMKKLTLSVAESLREQLLHELQALGAVHVSPLDTQSIEEDNRISDTWAKELKTITIEQSNTEENRRELSLAIIRIEEICNMKIPYFEVTSEEKINLLREKYDFTELANNLRMLDRTTRESEMLMQVLHSESKQIIQWANVIDNFDPIYYTNNTLRGIAGYINLSSLEDFKAALHSATDLVDILISYTENKEAYCYIVGMSDVWEKVNTVLKEKPFNTIMITKRVGDTKNIIRDLEIEISNISKKHSIAIKEWFKYSEKISDLALIHDILEIDIQRQKASAMAMTTESVNFFRAWVPEDLMPKVEAILSIHEKSIDIVIQTPIEDEYEMVPVSLKNNIITKPFSSLTSMYGTPMYGATVDPTPHLSVFYFIYYGICLGDAIYGLVLALFSAYMSFKNRANQSQANFYGLLAWSGVSAMIAGVIFGSYAGDLFSKYIPVPSLVDMRFTFGDGSSFFDKPLFVLFISLLLGATQLWYGHWIKFYIAIKNTGIQAMFNELPWLILLSGFFGWAVFSWIAGMAGLVLVSDQVVSLFFLLMKIGAGLIILNSIRKGFQKSFFSGLVGPLAGAWELYSISGYLSNLLSYARLLALGLSSGIIANVFNQLGFGMIESLTNITPILGIFGVLMLIFLHMFNLILGGFGAFVHALRLQFVEFFGQFIEGGGKEFSPLMRRGTHYTVK